MTGDQINWGRRSSLKLLLSAVCGLSLKGLASAANPNEREVKPEASPLDPDKIGKDSNLWVLDFKFKDPRVIKVPVPGRGQKVCWYLWYQVINNTGKPQFFIPDFEWVTLDKKTVHHDQVLPRVQEAIRAVEDPSDFLKIKNSVTVAAQPIPPSRENAEPVAVTGVAVWDDIDPDSNHFSIFIQGLSNGYALTDALAPDGEKVVRRKTLQLNFQRFGDRYYQKSEEIQFQPPAKWEYRASTLKVPGPQPPK